MRPANLGRYHGDVIPAIVSPQSANQSRKKSQNSAWQRGSGRVKISDATDARPQSNNNNGPNEPHLKQGGCHLDVSSDANPEVIDQSEKCNYSDGKQLSVANGKRQSPFTERHGYHSPNLSQLRPEIRQVD